MYTNTVLSYHLYTIIVLSYYHCTNILLSLYYHNITVLLHSYYCTIILSLYCHTPITVLSYYHSIIIVLFLYYHCTITVLSLYYVVLRTIRNSERGSLGMVPQSTLFRPPHLFSRDVVLWNAWQLCRFSQPAQGDFPRLGRPEALYKRTSLSQRDLFPGPLRSYTS